MKLIPLLFLSSLLWADLSTDPQGAETFNRSIGALREQLHEQFQKGALLAQQESKEADYQSLLVETKRLKEEISSMEELWRKTSVKEASGSEEAYALWDVGETTLAQLIMEYGASDYLYVIPPELSSMKISLFSSIPLPRESWNEMIEMILAHNGVGVRKLNSFAKQLFILKLDPSSIEGIVSRKEDLGIFSSHARIFYVLSPPSEQLRSIQSFFERFSDPKQTTVQSIGAKVVIVSTRETIEKLLELHSAVWANGQGKTVKHVNLLKIQPMEAEKVLKAVFNDAASKGRPSFYPAGADELSTLALPQGLILIGENETVERALRVVSDLETQLEDPSEKVIYWYSCKHSEPDDIAEVLEQVYDSLIGSNMDKKPEPPPPPPPAPVVPIPELNPAQVFPDRSTAYNPVLPVNPAFIQPGVIEQKAKSNFGNFIVDAKTASVLMVVRREELAKIKNLLKKLDVPKKMVQLDVLLVEKKLHDRNQTGINLLKLGSTASNTNTSSVNFETNEFSLHKGLFSFLFSRPAGSGPAFDLNYSFLLAQDDIRINANPSVLAINQTPATISVVEEISINNGAIQLDTVGGTTIEKSFTRAQFGITIVLTPTIHLPDCEEENEVHPGFVSLQTDITFDTTRHSLDDRPPVTRRHVKNDVRIADGETVILGGLRRKTEEDTREKIPFLGDLPGIGKLFGLTRSSDVSTEMFIFITPHIVRDPVEDLRSIRQKEYQMRAGDIPEFLQKLDNAKTQARKRLFENSMKMLMDQY